MQFLHSFWCPLVNWIEKKSIIEKLRSEIVSVCLKYTEKGKNNIFVGFFIKSNKENSTHDVLRLLFWLNRVLRYPVPNCHLFDSWFNVKFVYFLMYNSWIITWFIHTITWFCVQFIVERNVKTTNRYWNFECLIPVVDLFCQQIVIPKKCSWKFFNFEWWDLGQN